MSDFAISLAADAAEAAQAWLKSLQSERRMAAKTIEAYARDLGQFAGFMAGHLGEAPGNRALAELTVSDFRAFLARRRREGAESRTLARQLSSLRSFYRFAEKGLAEHPKFVEWAESVYTQALAGSGTMWMAVFADVGASLLVVANGLRLLHQP